MRSVKQHRLHPFDVAEGKEKRKNRLGLTDFTSCKIHYFTMKNSKSIKTCTVFERMQYARMGLLYVGKPMKYIISLKNPVNIVFVTLQVPEVYLHQACH